jgi:hypothetical protein
MMVCVAASRTEFTFDDAANRVLAEDAMRAYQLWHVRGFLRTLQWPGMSTVAAQLTLLCHLSRAAIPPQVRDRSG